MTSGTLVRVAAVTLLVFGGGGPSVVKAGAEPTRATDAGAARVRPAPPDADLLSIRDIFRYADQTGVEARAAPGEAPSRAAPEDLPPVPTSRVRFIGLVRRAGSPTVVLAIDGEVVLLREGEASAGFTVVGIRDETVRLRDLEGHETTLEVP